MTRLTQEREQEIRVWAEAVLHHGEKANIFELLAEIDRLRAELDDMRNTRAVLRAIRAEKECDLLREQADKHTTLIVNHEATIGQLREKLAVAQGTLERLKTVCDIQRDSLMRDGIKRLVQDTLDKIQGGE